VRISTLAVACLVAVGCTPDSQNTDEPPFDVPTNTFEAPVATNATTRSKVARSS
jgi:hypothetical protein